MKRSTPLASRVTIEPGKMGGEPCIRGTRIPAASLASLATRGATVAEILYLYPCLTDADIRAALRWVAKKKSTRARTPMKRRPRRPRPNGDPVYIDWIRRQGCCAPGCSAKPPSHAHHHSIRQRGIGQKASDRDVMPLCLDHHVPGLHALAGPFKGWTKAELREWQDRRVVEFRARWYGQQKSRA